jgi:sortase A
MADKNRKKGHPWLRNLLFLMIFLAGAGILAYPTVSDVWNRYRNSKLISTYMQTVQEMPKQNYDDLLQAAQDYNDRHTVNTIVDAFEDEDESEEGADEASEADEYDLLLNPMGDSVMGYLDIPKIEVSLAIYHGVGSTALENGCGHIEGTSLPIGGLGTHAVISAHRGLPSARLFTDLDQMEIGDLFFITVLGEKLAYQVDQILTVLPEETEALAIEEGKDLVTLVTCTPYAVNTHRLLVRGHRIEYTEDVAAEATTSGVLTTKSRTYLVTAAGGAICLVIILILYLILKRKRKKA